MDNRDFYKIFRGFLGLNRTDPGFPPDEDRDKGDKYSDQEHRNDPNFRNFQVFTDPLEIHKFFQQEMDEMFRNFGFQQHRPYLDENEPNLPSIRDFSENENLSDRDMMLKQDDIYHDRKRDTDFDEKDLSSNDLTDIFKNPPTQDSREGQILKPRDFDDRANSPGSSFPGFGDPESALRGFGFGFPDSRGFGFGSPDSRGFDFGFRFGSGAPESGVQTFSYSRSSKTIRRPDGSIETEERSRNPDGSETVKITRIVGGEKEETIIQQNPDTPGSGRSGRDGLVQDFNIFDGIDRGGRIGENPTEPSIIPPPADKKYSSIFSKFFGN
ncbi:uncharacterized protein LOC111699841 [Eurytemora carolleeae]|uniref:uncharacterized protein LOC111699841 n=1 Tax=Eurytemora carolleeae TaxID=1294199 RepID=UPI000C780F50|nr:uncharacterized protein LOC111699841 [Eurytemora carolleeae]|eukprot:XP_023326350.1 uncharacterized protein LOC111699841 [Eurytemora affinis]